MWHFASGGPKVMSAVLRKRRAVCPFADTARKTLPDQTVTVRCELGPSAAPTVNTIINE
jgi:hypothetical protein